MFKKNSMEFFVGLQPYLYYYYSGCTLKSHDHMFFPECSMITWPCHVILTYWVPTLFISLLHCMLWGFGLSVQMRGKPFSCFGALITTLSTNAATFSSFIRSLKILFIISWNMAGKFVILKNIAVGSKDPTCVVNAPFHSFSFLILILLNSHLRSILVNTFLLPILSIRSIINGSR